MQDAVHVFLQQQGLAPARHHLCTRWGIRSMCRKWTAKGVPAAHSCGAFQYSLPSLMVYSLAGMHFFTCAASPSTLKALQTPSQPSIACFVQAHCRRRWQHGTRMWR